jgi:sugar phosphate isomerase/epimerase
MKLGFVSAILPELSLKDVFEVSAAFGYDTVEVMSWPVGKAERRYAGVTHINVTDLGEKDIDEISTLQSDSGISISGLGYYGNPLTTDMQESERTIAHIKDVILGAEKLGISIVNTFVGRDWTLSIDANWPRFLSVWRPLMAFAEDHGVKVAIENCPMLFSDDEWPGGKNLAISPPVWDRMFTDIPSASFGLNFDPSHFIWQQMDYLKAIRDYGEKFFHVHAKDARLDLHRLEQCGIYGYPLEFHTPKLPGMGDVNWGQFFSALNDFNYKGAVCVEVEDRAFEGSLELRKDSLSQSYNYLKQFLPNKN